MTNSRPYQSLSKVIRVLESCKTPEQFAIAIEHYKRFRATFTNNRELSGFIHEQREVFERVADRFGMAFARQKFLPVPTSAPNRLEVPTFTRFPCVPDPRVSPQKGPKQ